MTRALFFSASATALLVTVLSCKGASSISNDGVRRPPQSVSRNQGNPTVQRAECARLFSRSGIPVRGTVTAADSLSFSLSEITAAGIPSRRFVFSFYGCLPIESPTGDRLTLSSLLPGRAVLVWMELTMRPTQPIQAVAEGVQLQEASPQVSPQAIRGF